MRDFACGDPWDEGTRMGPLVSAAHRDSVAGFLADDDARVAFRGTAPEGPGWWFPPTVLTPSPDSRVFREEIFGPVLAVVPFEDEADAVRLWDHVVGLAGFPGFAELKRSLRERPQLPALGVPADAAGKTEDWHGGSRRTKR